MTARNLAILFVAIFPLTLIAGGPDLKLEYWQAHYSGKLDDHDWLRPSDNAFGYFIQQVFESEERIDLSYTYRCGKGEYDFCYDELSYSGGRSVGYVILETPLALAVRAANARQDNFESPPTIEKLAKIRNVFSITVGAQSPDHADAPVVAIEHKGELITPTERHKSGDDVGECWTWEDEACWNNRGTFVFTVEKDTVLSGEGIIILRWRDSVDVKIPIDFDRLW